MKKTSLVGIALIASIFPVAAESWQQSEIHFTNGNLHNPFSEGKRSYNTSIVTYQYVNNWEFGDSFVMFDYIDDEFNDGFNDQDLYHESYFNFSTSKIFGINYGDGLLKDIGIFAGVNIAAQPKVMKYIPGIRAAWNIPGFIFFNTDVGKYVDHSVGVTAGGAPKQSNSWYFDWSFGYPFSIGNQLFSLEGHVEYISGRRDEFNNNVSKWLLIQPQLRWDAGHAVFGRKDKFFIGFEFQYWQNKLGVSGVDDKVAQLLAVWRF